MKYSPVAIALAAALTTPMSYAAESDEQDVEKISVVGNRFFKPYNH